MALRIAVFPTLRPFDPSNKVPNHNHTREMQSSTWETSRRRRHKSTRRSRSWFRMDGRQYGRTRMYRSGFPPRDLVGNCEQEAAYRVVQALRKSAKKSVCRDDP